MRKKNQEITDKRILEEILINGKICRITMMDGDMPYILQFNYGYRDNERSIRVLEKAGMTREGLRRKILPIRGEWRDNYHFAIVES